MEKIKARTLILFFLVFGVVMLIGGFVAGLVGAYVGIQGIVSEDGEITTNNSRTVSVVDEESAIIDAAQESSPSVVSVIISQEVPNYDNFQFNPFEGTPWENYFNERRDTETQERQVGAGSGFVISDDGMIITNRHVVDQEDANYTVIFKDDTRIEAEVLARDSILDIAVLKVDTDKELEPLPLGDSSQLKIGQTAIAIGNSLGEFSNTVSSGIISGLSRSIQAGTASGSTESLQGVIQTDASINQGNSGGPLLDIAGNVIGVNVAVASNAENIGFAIPINDVKPVIDSVEEFGEIRRPQLGVRYLSINKQIAEERDLPVNYGALLSGGRSGAQAILDGSPADEAGLLAGDIILEINGNQINEENTLREEILKYDVDEEVSVTYLRDGEENTTSLQLESRE